MTRRPFGARAPANIILVMGAAQLLFLKTGAHAAVDNTVELMRQAGFERLCGLPMRLWRLTRDGEALLATTHDAENLPDWLRLSWQHYWGDAATKNIAGSMLPPPLDIQLPKMPRHGQKSLMAKYLMATPSDANLTVTHKLPGFAEGAWWVQDAAAAMPAAFLASLMTNR